VLASFFVLDGHSPGEWALGFVLMALAAAGVGLLNGALIRFAKFTPVAATLVTYIGLGGLAFTLRSAPDGYIALFGDERHLDEDRCSSSRVHRLRPMCCRSRARAQEDAVGMRLRAVGSDEESAGVSGCPVNRTALLGYLGASLLTLLGAVVCLLSSGSATRVRGPDTP
jgi:ribose transport system ATP-binding protein